MSWSNNLLATHILQPHSSEAWTNRSRDATIAAEQDGKFTLLVILTTSTGLAIILLLLIFFRIGCLKGKICLKERHNEHNSPPSSTNDGTFSKAAQQPSNQTTFIHTMIEHDTSSSYTIKLIDNDLIIETQENEMFECEERPSLLGAEEESFNSTGTAQSPADSISFPQQHWLSSSECNHSSVALMEIKSLNSSPKTCPQVACEMVNEEHNRVHRSRFTHSPGFEFTKFRSSYCSNVDDDERQTYTYGNQLEYCGGLYGYVDPLFSCHYSHTIKLQQSSPGQLDQPRRSHLD